MVETLRSACLTIFAIIVVLAIAAAVVRWIRSRYLEVQEGYVIPVKWFGRHRRILSAGPHVLIPGESPGPQIEIRPRDLALDVPQVLTLKGLPVTLRLRYRVQFVPEHMQPAERYYPPNEWTEQQRRLFMDGLQRVIEQFAAPASGGQSEPTTLATVFSPFFSNPPFVLCHKLQTQVSSPLSKLGIELLPDTLIIERLDPPREVVTAYQQMLQTGFEASAATRFVQAIRAAAPDLSAAELANLYNSVMNNVSEVRTIFDGATFRPGLYFTDSAEAVRRSQPQINPVLASPPGSRIDTQPGTAETAPSEVNYPLRVEDMRLLKRLAP